MNGETPAVTGVRRIIRLEPGSDGAYAPVVLYDCRIGRKKKTTRMLRPIERLVRQLADAQSAAAIEYQERHRRSSVKRKNGWLRDLASNLLRSQQRARKRIKIMKIVVP